MPQSNTITIKTAKDLHSRGVDISDWSVVDDDGNPVELVFETVTQKQQPTQAQKRHDNPPATDGAGSGGDGEDDGDDRTGQKRRVPAQPKDHEAYKQGLIYKAWEMMNARQLGRVTTQQNKWLEPLNPLMGPTRHKLRMRSNGSIEQVRVKAETTLRDDVEDFTPTVVAPIRALIYESDFLAAVTPMQMTKSKVQIPQIVEETNAEAGVGPTAEGTDKPKKRYEANLVNLDAEAYGAIATIGNIALLDFPAFEQWVTQKLLGRIADKLEGTGISRLASGDHLVEIEAEKADEVSPREVLKLRHFMMGGRANWVYLMNPEAASQLYDVDKGAAFWFGGPDGLDIYRSIPVVYTHALDPPDEAEGINVILANMAEVAWGILSEPGASFNPFFGWTTNESSVRVEGFMDIRPAVNRTYTGQDNAATDGVTLGHFVALKQPNGG